jgi:hypothetical protein
MPHIATYLLNILYPRTEHPSALWQLPHRVSPNEVVRRINLRLF